MQLDTNNQIKASLIEAKKDELHYLNQIAKYLNHLYYTYTTGKLKNDNRAWYTKVGIKNCNSERERVEQEIEDAKEH